MNEEKKNDNKKLVKTSLLIITFMAGYYLGTRKITINLNDNRK